MKKQKLDESEIDYWLSTDKGEHFPVKKGQTKEEAYNAFLERVGAKEESSDGFGGEHNVTDREKENLTRNGINLDEKQCDDLSAEERELRRLGIAEKQSFEKAYGFADKTRKNTSHHKMHAKEMGYKNQDEYERAAVEFFNNGKGKIFYSDKRGTTAKYDEYSEKYVVVKDGNVKTFYKINPKKFKKIKEQEGYEEN